MSTTALMTAEQYAHLRTGETEDYELVEGELIALPSGTPLHAKIRDETGYLVRGYLKRNSIGAVYCEIDCRISEYSVRRPDLSIFLGERAALLEPNKIPVPFPPDIAVEVLSLSEAAVDVNRKVLEYLAAGTGEVWLLDHANAELFVQTNAGVRLLRAGGVLESPLLPGFSAPVADLLVLS